METLFTSTRKEISTSMVETISGEWEEEKSERCLSSFKQTSN